MNKYDYKSALDKVKFNENLDTKIINSLNTQTPARKKFSSYLNKKTVIPAAALCTLVLFISLTFLNKGEYIDLPHSSGNISAEYIRKLPKNGANSSGDLVWLTEEELFTQYTSAAFKGTVEEIQNIKIDFNDSINYRAIAKIKVEKTYKGKPVEGEVISVLLPCPIDTNLWVEDTDVISNLRVGVTGIFMPMAYDDTMYWEENGAKLQLNDIAQYGLADGMRYAFLETDSGLIFERQAYESISSAKSLEEIEAYVLKMIN